MFHLLLEQNSNTWLEFKKSTKRITSTEISSVLHLNPNKSKAKLWREKNEKQTKRNESNVFTQIGRMLEPVALNKAIYLIQEWRQNNDQYFFKPGVVLDPYSPLCSCSPDMMFCSSGEDLFGIELKIRVTRPVPNTISEIDLPHLVQAFSSLHICRARAWYLFYMEASLLDEREMTSEQALHAGKLSLFKIYPNDLVWKEILNQVQQFLEEKKNPPKKNKKRDGWMEKMISNGVKIKRFY